VFGARAEFVAVQRDFTLDTRRAHLYWSSVGRKALPLA
jgi:hypothetical protein